MPNTDVFSRKRLFVFDDSAASRIRGIAFLMILSDCFCPYLEHGDIVFRHEDGKKPHIIQALFPAGFPGVHIGASGAVAAGEDKVGIPVSEKDVSRMNVSSMRAFSMHNRANKHKRFFGMKRLLCTVLYDLVNRNDRISLYHSDHLCCVAAVSCTAEAKDPR
jgi:hypothetical protein